MIATRLELRAGDASAVIAPDEGGLLLSLRVGQRELLGQSRPGTEPVPTFGSDILKTFRSPSWYSPPPRRGWPVSSGKANGAGACWSVIS